MDKQGFSFLPSLVPHLLPTMCPKVLATLDLEEKALANFIDIKPELQHLETN